MLRREDNNGFTLIELVTVLTVTSVLMAMFCSLLGGARKAARAVVCQTNIRSTGLAFLAYCESYDGYLPPAYSYVGASRLYSQPGEPVLGIRHWSGLFLAQQYISEDALHCPEISQGGLAPQNTEASNLDMDQASGREGIIDLQAERCAFTVNETLCPRNRFRVGFEGVQRPSRVVSPLTVRRLGDTILMAEWPDDWRIVSGPDSDVSNSYLPVHGFRGLGEMVGPDRYDLNMTVSDSERPCQSSGAFRRVNADDLSNEPMGCRRYPPRLDWVGRNHSGIVTRTNMKTSSFFYLDGHAELKTIYDTVAETDFEWGDRIYSLTGHNKIN